MQATFTKQNDAKKEAMKSWRRGAMILILLADLGLLAWGAMAAIAPEHFCSDQILSQSLAPNMRASPGTPGRNLLPQPRRLPIF